MKDLFQLILEGLDEDLIAERLAQLGKPDTLCGARVHQ